MPSVAGLILEAARTLGPSRLTAIREAVAERLDGLWGGAVEIDHNAIRQAIQTQPKLKAPKPRDLSPEESGLMEVLTSMIVRQIRDSGSVVVPADQVPLKQPPPK